MLVRQMRLIPLLSMLAILTAALFLIVRPARAAIITVDTAADENNTNAAACSLREALIAAAGTAQAGCVTGVAASDDTINITAAGPLTLITGQLNYTDSGNLILNGGGLTVNANDLSRVLEINAAGSTITLNNITLTNGRVSGSGVSGNGGGILLSAGTLILNSAVTISDNVATVGGGIYTADFPVTVRGGSRIAGNTAVSGGGIYALREAADVLITGAGTAFTANRADRGGGIYAERGADVTVTDSATISDNTAITGGGIYLTAPAVFTSTLLVSGSATTITGNRVTQNGGGIIASDAPVTVEDGARITNNTANYGGGIWTSSPLTVQGGAQITGNTVVNYGGGIAASGGTADVLITGAGTAVTANQAIHPVNGSGDGGGVQASGGARVTVTDSATISNHTASRGSGVYVTGTAALRVSGGATITGNTANNDGGGVFVAQGASVSVDAASITLNEATNRGGAVYLDNWPVRGHLTLVNGAEIHRNTAANGGGIFNNGGIVSVSGSRITYNTGTNDGSAITQAEGSTTLSNTCIVCNSPDSAVSFTGGTNPMSLGGNWWGHAWGPNYSASAEGLQCSPGDSLNPAQALATYGITVTTPQAACAAPPTGNWLTTPTGGCAGTEITAVSTTDPSARICAPH